MKLNLSVFLQNKFNVYLFRNMPASFCYWYMQLLGRLYYLVRRRERRQIETNIREMLKNNKIADRVVRETFKGIFAHYYEKLFSAFRDLDQIARYMRRKVTVQNSHLLGEAMESGKGVILVTAHWGAVEFIPWVLGLSGYPVSVILECQTKHLETALAERARFIKAEMISCDGATPVFARALESLSNNRLLMTECDEVDTWHKRQSRTIDLFGQRLYLDNTLNILARRSGAKVLGVFLKRVSSGRYSLIVEPISGYEDTATGALNLWQKYVTQNPEQWYQWKKWQAMKAG